MNDTERSGVSRHWYRTSFGTVYPVVYAHRTIAAAKPEVAFALRVLEVRRGERILDLCCGNGRHMVHLARATTALVGLDYSPELLERARRRLSRRAGLVRGDMRALPFGAEFDIFLNFFTSFGYFFDECENQMALREAARVLKPGGRFLLDHVNPEYLAGRLVPETVRKSRGHVIHETRWIDQRLRRVNKRTSVERDGEIVGEWSESVRLYAPEEILAVLTEAGLLVEKQFGDYEGRALSSALPRMISIGRKE